MRPDPHADCEAGYECIRCGGRVCPRCDPSPQELNEICADCDWRSAA